MSDLAYTLERDVLLREIETLKEQLYALKQRIIGPAATEELPEDELFIIICRVGDERMAFLLERIEEAVMAAELTPIPESPPWVPGFLNLRGVSVPILDVQARMEKNRRALQLSDMILMGYRNQKPFGIIVQEILDIASVHRSQLHAAGQDVLHAPYLLGVLHIEQYSTLLLSIERLWSGSEVPEDTP